MRRAGRLTASQQRALDDLWPRYGIEFTPGFLDFQTLFDRSVPVVLEIGFGNGDTLVEMAATHPDRDYLGIEVHDPGVGHCLIAAEKAGVDNLRLIAHDAIEVLEQQVAPGGTIHVATDWANYAEHIDEAFAGSAHFRCTERREHDGDRPLDRPVTKFERRGLRHGHRIVDWRFEKNAL